MIRALPLTCMHEQLETLPKRRKTGPFSFGFFHVGPVCPLPPLFPSDPEAQGASTSAWNDGAADTGVGPGWCRLMLYCCYCCCSCLLNHHLQVK